MNRLVIISVKKFSPVFYESRPIFHSKTEKIKEKNYKTLSYDFNNLAWIDIFD